MGAEGVVPTASAWLSPGQQTSVSRVDRLVGCVEFKKHQVVHTLPEVPERVRGREWLPSALKPNRWKVPWLVTVKTNLLGRGG